MAERRMSYTNQIKLQCIKRIRNGTKLSAICAEYGISKSTVSTWLKMEGSIQDAFNKGNLLGSRNRRTKNDQLDNALLQWFKHIRDINTTVRGPLLLTKANEIAEMMDCAPVGKSWVDRWKKRHNIRVAKTVGTTECQPDLGFVTVGLSTVSEAEWKFGVLPGSCEIEDSYYSVAPPVNTHDDESAEQSLDGKVMTGAETAEPAPPNASDALKAVETLKCYFRTKQDCEKSLNIAYNLETDIKRHLRELKQEQVTDSTLDPV